MVPDWEKRKPPTLFPRGPPLMRRAMVALVLLPATNSGRAVLTRAGSPAALLPIVAKRGRAFCPRHTPALGGDGAVPAFSTRRVPMETGRRSAAAQIMARTHGSSSLGRDLVFSRDSPRQDRWRRLALTSWSPRHARQLLRHLFRGARIHQLRRRANRRSSRRGRREPSVILMNPPFLGGG